MSKKILILSAQPDPDGPVFGRVSDPNDFQNLQTYAHEHIEQIVKEMLMSGGTAPVVSGFAISLTGGLGISIGAGDAVDLAGISYSAAGATALTISAADTVHGRIDLVYGTLQDEVSSGAAAKAFRRLLTSSELDAGTPPYPPTSLVVPTELDNLASISIRVGTPASSPVAPTTGSNEIPLYSIAVAANATSVSSGNVTDLRKTMRSLAQALVLIDALSGSVGDIGETIDDRVAGLLQDGTGIVLTYDDADGTLTIAGVLSSASVTGLMTAAQFQKLGVTSGANQTPQPGYFLKGAASPTGATEWDQLNSGELVAGLGYTPANKGGDTFGGAVSIPVLTMKGGGLNVATSIITSPQPGRQIALAASDGTRKHILASFNGSGSNKNMIVFYLWTDAQGVNDDGITQCLQITPGTTFHIGDVDVSGSLAVVGAVSKGSGTFKIDHPLDPANKDLYHGFVESPRYDLIYRGSAKLVGGRAYVSIDDASGMTPGTFEALTQNAQGHAWNESGYGDNWDLVRVVEIRDGMVHIASNNPGSDIQVGWMVVAERADAFIKYNNGTDNEGRLRVEVEKEEISREEQDSLMADRLVDCAVDSESEMRPDRNETENVNELIGKRGFPAHAPAIGLDHPKRRVVVRTVLAARKADLPDTEKVPAKARKGKGRRKSLEQA